MQRFAAGIRAVTALLVTSLLAIEEPNLGPLQLALLGGYCCWSGWLLWMEITDRGVTGLWPYWADVAITGAILQAFAGGTTMLIITLVQPVVLASIGYGVPHGVALALAAAVALMLDTGNELVAALHQGWSKSARASLVLALVPAAALLARPMSLLRRRLALVEQVEASLDPRRGRDAICGELVERLRCGTHADVVALVLPSALGAPATFATRDEGTFRGHQEAHARLEELLARVPGCAVSHVVRRWWDLRRRTRLHAPVAAPRGLGTALSTLATTLGVSSLHVVPLQRYAHQYGHFVIGYAKHGLPRQDLAALAGAAPELLRIIEQATLVDQLQEESAGHERARIGRDLHDSAIQPYLGLKYAVECVALRMAHDNPARGEVQALAELVNGEVATLRELVSTLRTGSRQGDDALVPAVRRQVRRFALLFGIEVALEVPEHLSTSRALAAALFHMINEALNNIRKHTAARRVWIDLSAGDGAIHLVVRDDAPAISGRTAADFTPRSLCERAAELGGRVQVDRTGPGVTELSIVIPQ